jgi:hypothetical protein
MFCAQNGADGPARKRTKHASWTLTEKILLLDHARNNPKLSYDELGEALAAEYNSKVKDDRDKRKPVKKPTIAGWKKQEAAMGQHYDEQTAKEGVFRTRKTQS